MSESGSEHQWDDRRIEAALRALERRVAVLETRFGLEETKPASKAGATAPANHSIESTEPGTPVQFGLELQIGEFALPWVGSAVFLLGIAFLMAYVSNLGYPVTGSALGYAAAGGLFLLSILWKQKLPYMGRIMLSCSLMLLYYATMRLHFFSGVALVSARSVAVLLVLLIVALQFYFALRRASQALAGMAMVLALLTAALGGRTHLTLPLIALCAIVGVYLAVSRRWWRLLNATVVLVYLSHFLWLLNNPVLDQPLRVVKEPQFNLVYLFSYALVFALPPLLAKDKRPDQSLSEPPLVLNCLGLFVVASIVMLAQYRPGFEVVCLVLAAFFLSLSAVFWKNFRQEFIPAVYACSGYLSLSLAIYGYEGIPGAYLWLSLQSLLVVSMALWFRSKILVVLNSLIYVGILLAYVGGSPTSDLANFSFALVAFASARVMNWQKQRLTLRTELLRNVYLTISMVFLLYALYRAVPNQYVTLSWTVVAVAYFQLSIMLRNLKYRWMAMSTLLATVVYLFLVDLGRLSLTYRVAACLFLGLMALAISLFYSRIRHFVESRTR